MKSKSISVLALVIMFAFSAMFIANPNVSMAAKKNEIIFSTATPMYPAFAEQIGINLYINALVGLTQTHPALKNKVKIKIYDKGMLCGNQSEALEAVSNGALQLTYSGPHFLEELDPTWKLGELPGMFEDWNHFKRTMATPAWKELHEKMAKEKGVTILGWLFDTGTWYLYTKTGPIKGLPDIKGQKIRFAGGEAFAKALKALGTTPIALPYTEVVTALQTNLIEGLLTDFTGGVGYFELNRHTKYAVLVPFGNQPICMIANTKWWNSLDPKVREAIMIPFNQIDASSYYKEFEKQGIKDWAANPKLEAVQFDKAEIAKWQTEMRNAFTEMFGTIDSKYIEAVEAAR
jgi:TRAP-type C4-dicarboxylate transport system substrate-binding protein